MIDGGPRSINTQYIISFNKETKWITFDLGIFALDNELESGRKPPATNPDGVDFRIWAPNARSVPVVRGRTVQFRRNGCCTRQGVFSDQHPVLDPGVPS
jgi:hypothetical protein